MKTKSGFASLQRTLDRETLRIRHGRKNRPFRFIYLFFLLFFRFRVPEPRVRLGSRDASPRRRRTRHESPRGAIGNRTFAEARFARVSSRLVASGEITKRSPATGIAVVDASGNGGEGAR